VSSLASEIPAGSGGKPAGFGGESPNGSNGGPSDSPPGNGDGTPGNGNDGGPPGNGNQPPGSGDGSPGGPPDGGDGSPDNTGPEESTIHGDFESIAKYSATDQTPPNAIQIFQTRANVKLTVIALVLAEGNAF
jgi:hypothetical protein